jgi:hypothetical protein
MLRDIRTQQAAREGSFFASQPRVEADAAALLAAGDAAAARRLLAEHSQAAADTTAGAWTALTEFLITKYNDGFINTPGDISRVGRPAGYPAWWLKAVGYGRFPQPSPETCAAPAGAADEGGAAEVGALRRRVALLERQLEGLGLTPWVTRA